MGYGDEIMVTGFARLAKQKYPHLQVVIGDKKSGKLYDSIIFKNNLNITKASNLDLSINKVWIENYFGKRPYVKDVDKERIYWNFNYRPVRGDLYFDDEEMNSAIFAFKKINEEWNLKFGNQMKAWLEDAEVNLVDYAKEVFDGEEVGSVVETAKVEKF